MKQKMSTADVAGEVACLRTRIMGMRVMNVYDINAKVRARYFRWCSRCDTLITNAISIVR